MIRISSLYGASLLVLGVAGFLGTGASSPTALIPAVFGLAVLALALGARRARKEPAFRRIGIGLLAVAAFAALGTVSSLLQLDQVAQGTAERPAAVIGQATMFVLSATYLLLVLASLGHVRRLSEGPAGGPNPS